MNTKEYVVNARNGDEHAIRQLMDSVSKKGKYIALEYVHDDAKAEDILQETFIKAFSSLDQLKDPDKFEPWFFTILNRLAINATNQKMIDKNSTNFSAYDSEDMNYEDSLTKDYVEFQPEENFDYSELKQGIQNIMEELPEAQRMAVYAYFFEGLNMREIADLYDVGESTIRARINAAKTKMHDMIKSLEAKGMPLFGAAPASVFQWYANGEVSQITVNKLSGPAIVQTIFKGAEVATKKGAAVAAKTTAGGIGKAITTKTIVIALATVATIGTTGTIIYQKSNQSSQPEQVVTTIEPTEEFNWKEAYKEALNDIEKEGYVYYILLDIDEDGVPEIYCEKENNEGSLLVTVINDEIHTTSLGEQMAERNVSYMPTEHMIVVRDRTTFNVDMYHVDAGSMALVHTSRNHIDQSANADPLQFDWDNTAMDYQAWQDQTKKLIYDEVPLSVTAAQSSFAIEEEARGQGVTLEELINQINSY